MSNFASWLWTPLERERRANLPMQIIARWALAAVALFVINWEPGTSPTVRVLLNVFVAGAAATNTLLHWRFARGGVLPNALPLLASIYDAAAISGAVFAVDGLDNPNFVLYYPALLAFTFIFSGWPSALYGTVTLGTYVVAVLSMPGFDAQEAADVKAVVLRLTAMAVTVVIGNLAVGIERARRAEAVADAIAAHQEQDRLVDEIHDGVAQHAYILTATLRAAQATNLSAERREELLRSISSIARELVLDTRSLFASAEPSMRGSESLGALVDRYAREFSAVTDIPVTVRAADVAGVLPPGAVGEAYRIVCEGLSNVFRHAHATHVNITLRVEGDRTIIEVADDGVGMVIPTEDPGSSDGGRGLRGMRARAERIGAELIVESSPGHGTTLRLAIPGANAVEQAGHAQQNGIG